MADADPELTMADVESEMSLDEISSLKVTDLRKKLKALGLPITGNKTELVERLQEACLSNKEDDSFDKSRLSFEASQISGLDSVEDSEVLEENALLDQEQFASYIGSSLDDNNPKLVRSVENSVIMPPKKRTFSKSNVVETAEKKMLINRTNATDLEFDIEENQTKSKTPIVSPEEEKSTSDEKIKLHLKSMSAAERLAMRAKRFNTNGSEAKTVVSSKPIISTNNRNSKQSILSSATTPDLDVLKKRAERFGQSVSTVMKQIEQKEKLLKRKNKYGTTLAVTSVDAVDEQAKKRKRAERFGVS